MTSEIRRNLGLFWLSQLYGWRSAMAYRLQFIFYFVFMSLDAGYDLVFASVIYGVSGGISGWSYYQLLLLMGLANIVSYFCWYLLSVQNISDTLLRGRMDAFMARPYSLFPMFLTQFGDYAQMGGVVGGVLLFSWAAVNLGLSPASFVFFALVMLCGSVVYVMLNLFFSVASYNLFKGGWWVQWLSQDLATVSRWPISIFGKFGTLLFTFVVPIGLATFYPAEVLVGGVGYLAIAKLLALSVALMLILRSLTYMAFKGYASGGG